MSKRLFNSEFLEKDIFIELPIGAKILYIYLNMYADDEGFIGSTKKALVMSGATIDDMKVLLAKNLIKELDENDFTKVYLVTDFFQNNSEKLVYSEGFEETMYQVAKSQVVLVNKIYMNIEDYERLQNTQPLQLTTLEKGHAKHTKKGFEIPTIEEIEEYIKEKDYKNVDAKRFFDWYDANGWKTNKGQKIKSWKQSVGNWDARGEQKLYEASHQEIDYMKF